MQSQPSTLSLSFLSLHLLRFYFLCFQWGEVFLRVLSMRDFFLPSLPLGNHDPFVTTTLLTKVTKSFQLPTLNLSKKDNVKIPMVTYFLMNVAFDIYDQTFSLLCFYFSQLIPSYISSSVKHHVELSLGDQQVTQLPASLSSQELNIRGTVTTPQQTVKEVMGLVTHSDVPLVMQQDVG